MLTTCKTNEALLLLFLNPAQPLVLVILIAGCFKEDGTVGRSKLPAGTDQAIAVFLYAQKTLA